VSQPRRPRLEISPQWKPQTSHQRTNKWLSPALKGPKFGFRVCKPN
jgi:hypothetical protein